VLDLVGAVVCGDDAGVAPKPSAEPALRVCRALGCSPSDGIVVGDTSADLAMASAAGLRGVGVLSGVGTRADLAGAAVSIVPSVDALLPLLGLPLFRPHA